MHLVAGYCIATAAMAPLPASRLIAENFGMSPTLRVGKGFQMPTQVIFGTNSIEHGVNLLEEQHSHMLVVHGWNAAEMDMLLWEIEPRGFHTEFYEISSTPSLGDVDNIIQLLSAAKITAMIAIGGESVVDVAKVAAAVYNGGQCSPIGEQGIDKRADGNSADGEISTEQLPLLLCTIPLLPAFGAELSSTASLYDQSNASDRVKSKKYFRVPPPNLCLVQPLSINRADMININEHLLCLALQCIEILLSDPGYLPELLAMTSLRDLIPILDMAAEVLSVVKNCISLPRLITNTFSTLGHRSKNRRYYCKPS